MKTGKMLVGTAVAAFLVAMAALAFARGTESAQQAVAPASSGVRVTANAAPSPTPSSSPSATPSPDGTVDISGPCDEAEHVNDPRCTQPGAADEDRSGPSHGQEDDRSGPSNDGNDEDNSGPSGNSGPGSSSDD